MKDHDHIRISFEDAYDEFLDPIFLFLASRLHDRERAKELTQETFVRAWKYLADGKRIERMRPFLYTTAYNLFKNELRAKRQVISLDSAMEDYGFELRDQGIPLEKALELKELVSTIYELPATYREVLIMRYVDGLAVKDIADILGETQVTISVRIHRGVNKLRTRYLYEGKAKTA